ncbi:MAG: type II secretion system protein [Acidobacteria bacterium]|nr:type II secretion system protein [Acidobacteriota bacterium]
MRSGFALLELLVAVMLTLVTLAILASALPPVLDVIHAVPEATDLRQRARATEQVMSGVIASAGAGPSLLGMGPLSLAIPAIWPRRLLTSPDPPGTAWADRVTVLRVDLLAAQAPLAASVPYGAHVLALAWHAACGVHPSCGFRRGDLVVAYDSRGALALARADEVSGMTVMLDGPVDQAIALPAALAVVSATALTFDATRRQVRRTDGGAPSQPVTDEVVGMQVRYYGNAAPPRWPAVPGIETCAVTAAGTLKLGWLGPVPGPPIELTVADLGDGPWCGAGTWRFDADLLRVRAVRIALRLQALSPASRGLSPLWFAMPGQARRPGQEVRDVELDLFAPAPNLEWSQ